MKEIEPELNNLCESVIGAAIEVHRHLGPGFLESTYAKALSIELRDRRLDHLVEHPVSLYYKGQPVGERRLDLLVHKQLVVELKAVDAIVPIHKAQVISYLKATGLNLGLLINFNTERLVDGVVRVIETRATTSHSDLCALRASAVQNNNAHA